MPPKSLKLITLAEFDKHNTEASCWTVYKNEVVDATKYMAEHPGGVDAILDMATASCTYAFDSISHSESARNKMKSLVIGTLSDEDVKTVEARTKGGNSGMATVIVLVVLVAVALYFVLM